MRSAYRLNLTGPGAIWAPSALLVLALLVFAFAPMRPVASAQPKAANIAVGTSANMIFAAGITKDSVPPTGSAVAPGQVIVYNITASNGTPSLTTTGAGGFVRITDTAPAGTLFQNAAVNQQPQFGSAWSCVIGGGGTTLTCSAGDGTGAGVDTFTVQETLKIRVEAVVQPATPEGTVLTNTATLSFSASGGAPTELITSNATTHVVLASADLAADLSASKAATPVVDPDGAGPLAAVPLPVVGPNVPPGSVNSGGYIRYDVPFGNSGPANAINVLITDQISGNTAFVGALATGGVFVPAAQPPAVPFTFTIQAVDTVAPLGPNVNVTCTVTGAAGSQAIYCRPQGNTGLGAPGPYADGTLPADYNGTLTFFVKVNESVAGGTLVSNPANITSGLCPNGAPPVFPPSVCSSTSDSNTSNNTTLATQTVVIASSNLSISKIVQSAVTAASNPNQTGPIGPATPQNGAIVTGTSVLPGTSLTYRLTITNNGPSDVSNIRLTDVLPSGLETPPGRVLGARYVLANPVIPSGATFTCSPPAGVNPQNNPQGNGGTVVCTAPLLSANAPNNTAAIDITVFIDPATKANLVDVATVDATINNLNRPISGTTVLTTPVAATSDLALTKTHTADPITTDVTYTVTLTNNGPSAAQMVSMVDTLPPFQKITNVQIMTTQDQNGAPNFTCTAVPPVGSPGNTTSLTCTAPELPPNKNQNGTVNPSGTVKFLFTVRQDPLTPQPAPTLQNCVSATSMSTDPLPANNTNVCDTVPVIFSVAGAATKIDVPDPVIAGNLLTYTITAVNSGPSAALNFKITDPLPGGTIFISAVSSPGSTLTTPAVGSNGTVTARWDAAGGTPGGLTPPGVTRTLTIVVRVCPEVPCTTLLANTAIVSSDTPVPDTVLAIAPITTLVQARSNLSITKADSPDPVNSGSNLTYTITFANTGPSNSAGTVITDVLPPGFEVVSTTSTVTGTTFTQTIGGDTGDQVTVTANVGVLGAANQCTTTLPTSGTITIVAKVPPKYPNVFVTNTATITSGNCLADPDLTNNTATTVTEVSAGGSPGLAFPAASEASDQKAGSVLFYPLYTSNSSLSGRQNSKISLTNVGARDVATVHLFVVDGSSCSAQDVFICLTRNQTVSFRASDFDPGVTGYIVAVVVNESTGRPAAFNCLIGDAFVKFASGQAINYGAVAVSSLVPNPAGVDPLASSATLKFDGIHYNRLPRILAAGGIPSASDGNSTLLTLMAVGGNMSLSGAVIGPITGNLYDDRENNFSFNGNAPRCLFVSVLDDSFPRTFVSFSAAIPPGRSGWIKIRAFNDVAILGLLLNFNPNVDSSGGAFNQGHAMQALALTDSATLTIPVDFPACL